SRHAGHQQQGKDRPFHERRYKYHSRGRIGVKGMIGRRSVRAAGTAALGALALVVACERTPVPYDRQIAAWHEEKDRFMRESPQSPIPEDRRAAFGPLSYFPVDPTYRIPALLQMAPPGPVVEMPTSTGQRRRMRRV